MFRHFSQRTAIFDRHDLPKLRKIGSPVGEDLLRACRIGIARVLFDELMEAFCEDRPIEAAETLPDYRTLPSDVLLTRILQGGIVGL